MKNQYRTKNQRNFQKKPAAKSTSQQQHTFSKIADREPLIIIAILVLTFCCYWPALTGNFISTWDDNAYITNNMLIRSLSPAAIRQIFVSQVGGSYVPLTILSFAVEYNIWGLNPLPYHVTNLLLHLMACLLVFQILRKLKIKPVYAGAAALIYGIHPMGVESVAWVTERKDLLYSGFYFGSLLLYIYYVQRTSKKPVYLLASLFLFILALFSKIQAVSLPIVLLLVDYYFGRREWMRIALEKVPYFVFSLLFGIAGIFILRNVGALRINEIYTFSERLLFGAYALSAYFLKFFIPMTLSALHPYPGLSGSTFPILYYLSPVFVLATGLLIYFTFRKTRAVVFGILFFLFSIFFMLQVFGAGQGFLADRFTRVPYLGMAFIAGWGLENLMDNPKRKRTNYMIWLIFSLYIMFLAVSTFQRCKVWNNGETLWTDVISKYPARDSRPYSCRGVFYREQKENDKALADFNMSLSLDKSDFEIRQFRGNIYFDKGMDDSAYRDYTVVLRQKIDNALALSNLGAIYVRRGRLDSAVYCLTKSIQLDSTLAFSYANRAVAFDALGRIEESIDDFKHYLTFNNNDERVFVSIALACQKLSRYHESLEWFGKAIVRKPEFGSYYYYRSQTYRLMGDRTRALADGLKALDLGVKVPTDYIRSLQ